MLKIKTKIVIFTHLILLTILGSQPALAAPGNVILGPKCAEDLVTYNPTGTTPTGNTDKYILKFTEDQCKQHAPYPNQHLDITAQEADNTYLLPQAAITDNIATMTGNHFHYYHNTSEEDPGNSANDYIYKSYIAAFEIVLHNDTLNNTFSQTNLVCPPLTGQTGTIKSDFETCKNGSYDPNSYGGTKITRTNAKDSQNRDIIKITWSYGVDDASLRPWRSGHNPSVDLGDNPEIFPYDTSDPYSQVRTWGSYVWLIPQDKSPAKVWSATTTSRALIVDTGLPKSKKFQYNDGNAWIIFDPKTYSTHPETQPVFNPKTGNTRDYYWVPIGNVISDWKKPTPPPPSSTCTYLDLASSTPLVNGKLPANSPTTFTVTPHFSNGPINLKYKWTSTAGGLFKSSSTSGPGQSTFWTSASAGAKSTYYEGGSSGTITVEAYNNENGQQYSPCTKTITVAPPPSATCAALSLSLKQNNQNIAIANVLPNLPIDISVTPSFNPVIGAHPALKYSWKAGRTEFFQFKAYGQFDSTHPADGSYYTNISSVKYSGGEDLTVSVQAYYSSNGAKADPCYIEFTIPPPPPANCTGLSITSAPKPLTTNANGKKVLPKDTPTTFNVVPGFDNPDKPVSIDYTWSATALKTTVASQANQPTQNLNLNQLNNVNLNVMSFNAVLLAPSGIANLQTGLQNNISQMPLQIESGYYSGLLDYLSLGQFKDNIKDNNNNLANPYTDNAVCTVGLFGITNCADDREIYYTGGQPGTLIRVVGTRHGNATDDFGGICSTTVIIEPEENTCVDLTATADPPLKEETPSTLTVNPTFKDNTKPFKLNYRWSTSGSNNNLFGLYIPGKFSNDSSKQDLNNPYTEKTDNKTYYTGGSGDTKLSVIAQDTYGNQYPACKADLIVPKTPGLKECLKFEPIIQDAAGGPILIQNLKADTVYSLGSASGKTVYTDNSPIENYNITITNSKGHGQLEKTSDTCPTPQQLMNYPSTSIFVTAPVTCKYKYTSKAGDQVYMSAIPSAGAHEADCKVSTTIPGTPEAPVCNDEKFTLTSSAGNELQPNTNTELRAGGYYTNEKPVTTLNWYATEGLLYPQGLCKSNIAPAQTLKNVPVECPVIYGGGSNGARVGVSAYPEESGRICKREISVIGIEVPFCRSLTINPAIINAVGSTTTYTASAQMNDGKTYDTSVFSWTSDRGDNVQLPQTGTYSYYRNNQPNSNINVSFEGVPGTGITDKYNNCRTILTAALPVTPYCKEISLSPNDLPGVGSSSNYTVKATYSDGNSYNANFNWSSDYNSPQTLSSNSSYNYTRANAQNAWLNVQFAGVPGRPEIREINGSCSTNRSASEQPNQCTSLTVNQKANGDWCANVTSGYENQMKWISSGLKFHYTSNICIQVDSFENGSYFTVSVPGQTNCITTQRFTKPETPSERPTFNKYVQQILPAWNQNTRFTKTLTANYNPLGASDQSPTDLKFKLEFTANSADTDATISDPAFNPNGYITGKLLPDGKGATPGQLKYQPRTTSINSIGSFTPSFAKCLPLPPTQRGAKGRIIQPPMPPKINCWESAKSTSTDNTMEANILDGIKLYKIPRNEIITITYNGRIVNSPIFDPETCVRGIVCEEIYLNNAGVTYNVYNPTGRSLTGTLNDYVRIQLFCQYILSRAAGDIFLESDLNSGVDINQCSKFKTGTGVVVTPAKPPTPKTPGTGLPATIFTLGHEVCSAGQTGTIEDPALKTFYGKDVTNLSSQICEIKLQTGKSWQQETIANSIEENLTRLARWEKTLGILNNDLFTNNPDQSVFKFTDADVTINEQLEIPEGAKTIIIEGRDLIINKNITYKKNPTTTSVKEIPSVAFIVLGGNIYVDKDVTELAGIYYAQAGKDAKTGEISKTTGLLYSGSPRSKSQVSTKQLTIYGSVYGDIQPLFGSRQYAGDPSQDQAGITIRFDQRVILNTPPGLRDIISVTEEQVAR